MSGINGRAGIALLFCIVPIRLISQELQVQLTSLQFSLLQTHKICIQLRENIREAFAGYCAQPIDIP